MKMLRKWKFLALIIFIAFIAILVDYARQSVYYTYPFFRLSLTPNAPIDELILVHYALSSYVAATPVAKDGKGNLYIAGRKNSRVRILVLNPEGDIVRIITPRTKDGQFLDGCLFSVSPSGNRIWTISSTKMNRVILHDSNGEAEQEWMIEGQSPSHLLLNAYSENGAYLATDEGFFHFTFGRNYPQRFQEYTSRLFFHNGKYWHSDTFDALMGLLPEQQRRAVKARIVGVDPAKLWGIVSWTHRDGFRLERIFPVNRRMSAMIHGIDQDGNLYVLWYEPFKRPLDFILNFLFKFKPLAKGMEHIGICNPKKRRIEAIKVFSSSGEILDIIPITLFIKQRGDKMTKVLSLEGEIRYYWEETSYGQIVKIDKTGIYLEVAVGGWRQPREYQIVRIVKKPRWKIWWERLRKRMGR